MTALILLAAKSLIVAGAALLILRLMRTRSAAERSWVAHLALLALVVLPFAPLAMPTLAFEAPALLGDASAPVTTATIEPIAMASIGVDQLDSRPATAISSMPSLSLIHIAAAAYWLPAAVLLAITLLALGRLLALQARAEVLTDGRWLSALARAQKRMGFKHGTALLTSDDLPSPISWGLMRPVILLNSKAVEAADEAEAIIAHELAHVARLDWIKLLLARVATAMFWFNPLVWILAREAHQLREEAADDTVLAADIADTDYAELLVGIARHECKGLLIGAHGVAPSKSSLARRVARVLDRGSARGPVAGSFVLGVLVGAAAFAAPLAAVTLVPGGAQPATTVAGGKASQGSQGSKSYYAANPSHALADVIGDSVATTITGAVAGVSGLSGERRDQEKNIEMAIENRDIETRAENAPPSQTFRVAMQPGSVGPRGKLGPQTIRGPRTGGNALDHAIAMKAVGVTPQYLAEMSKVLPRFDNLDYEDIIGLYAVGVSPQFVREMADAGYTHLDADELMGARAVGLTGQYARSFAAVGYPRLDLDDLTAMRAVGVTPADVAAARRQGFGRLSPDELVKYKTLGLRRHNSERPERPERPERAEQPEPPEPPEQPERN